MPLETHAKKLLHLLDDLKSTSPEAVTEAPVRVTRKNVFRHPEAHPLVLDLLLLKKYQEQWLGWEIETIERRVPIDFDVDRVSDMNVSKIQAMRTLHLVDTFWQRWEVFVWCSQPLNATFPDFLAMQVPSVSQCAIAVDIANRVRDDLMWSEEIAHYLEVVHKHEGIVVPQPPLDFVHVNSGGYPIDVEDVRRRWSAVRAEGKAPSKETPEDEQLRRMLHVRQELLAHQAQLRQQLEILHG